MQLLANKRIWIVTAVILATAFTFWGGSRYPSLDQKAIMGGSATLEDPLSFEASIQIQPDDGTAARILYTTINWIETNLQGMAFGLTIGACLLTLIGMIPSRGHRNGFVNTLYGLAIGVPLGVCVNCSAPVAKGMHDGGARLETTLATMVDWINEHHDHSCDHVQFANFEYRGLDHAVLDISVVHDGDQTHINPGAGPDTGAADVPIRFPARACQDL